MEHLYVLKDESTGKYYSKDKVFIEPNKQFAKKLRIGQARSLRFTYNRWGENPNIVTEEVE
ncbi:MAG: hypothetical protein LUH21_04240 [Clostridiales bacterium]|nr:hypothetical protein [Clostridiales bacterium]